VERVRANWYWNELQIAGEQAHRVQRVLDVRQGELCWVTGTIYMDMPLKPNVLDDVAKDVSTGIIYTFDVR
jgi:DNA polymerase delta subunit 2